MAPIIFIDSNAFISNLKAALRTTVWSKQREARADLAVVRLEPYDGKVRFVGANGHWLWVNELAAESTKRDAVNLSKDDCKRILKALSSKLPTVELDTAAGEIRQTGTRVSFASVQMTYPPYEEFMQSACAPGEATLQGMTFGALYLGEIAAAFGEVSEDPALTFHANKAIIVTSIAPGASEAIVVLMPRRDGAGLAA